MANKKLIAAVLLTLGWIIFLAALFTPLTLFGPYYAFFWALTCWVIGGMIMAFMKEKKSEEGR